MNRITVGTNLRVHPKMSVFAPFLLVLMFSASGFSDVVRDTALIPFLVNADAKVIAYYSGDSVTSINVLANAVDTLAVDLGPSSSVRRGGVRGSVTAPSLSSDHRGNVNLSLPSQSYRTADISLYSVNGRRVMRHRVNVAGHRNSFSRSNVAPGVYILSVKGVDNNSFTSRLAHRGGRLNVNVAFGGSLSSPLRHGDVVAMSASDDEDDEWTIEVTASGHFDSVYTLVLERGVNPLQEITLRPTPPTYTLSVVRNLALGGDVTVTIGNDSEVTNPDGEFSNIVHGTQVIVAVTPNNLYAFVKWTGAPASVVDSLASVITFEMIDDVELTAIFFGGAEPSGPQFNPDVVYGSFVDERDNRTYFTVLMPDGKEWMAENLNYNPGSGNSWCYNNSPGNCNTYGRLYDWATAMAMPASCNIQTLANCGATSGAVTSSQHRGVCPSGWRLPSRDEWDVLITAVGGDPTAGTKLKSGAHWESQSTVSAGTNDYGFSALPGGQWQNRLPNNNFQELNLYGRWWTSTEASDVSASMRSMRHESEAVATGNGMDKLAGYSVRCVRN